MLRKEVTMGTLQTQHDMMLSFYNEFGDLNVYAKQNDTQRYIRFEFTEDVIPSDTSNFFVYIRGKFSDGSYIPIAQITGDDNEIGEDYILFHIPSGFLAVPGKTVCDLVLCEGDPNATINPDGTIDSDAVKIISTHQFNIFVEAMASYGAHFSQHEKDEISELTRLLIVAKILDEEIQANEDARVTAETARIEAETARVAAEEARITAETERSSAETTRQTNEAQRVANEERRENAETGYIAQAKSYAIGDETARTGSSTDNAKFYYDQAKDAVYGKGLMELSIDENGHLKYTRTDDLSRYTFSIRDNKELILTYDSTLITPPTITDSELEYNGEVQRPTITGYSAGTVMFSGDLEATEVGNYQIFVTPAPGYEWDGNYPQFVTLNWSIITS